jgi:antitoxin component of MazEF toxin-antitoxin module
MAKKDLKDTVTITISKNTASAVGLEEGSDITVIALDDMLIIKPKHHKPDEEAKRALTQSLIDQYEEVLKKLAKT